MGVLSFPLENRDLASVSREEIIKCIPNSPEFRYCNGAPSIARVSSSAVVKWGRHIHLYEARNMQYVAEHTQIPVPAVIDAWEVEDATHEEESNTCYILMQMVPGTAVIDLWDDLDESACQKILHQLSDYVRQLQGLELDTPGPIGNGISESMLFTAYGAGPFNSARDLEEWYNGRLLVCHDFGHARHLSPGAFSGTFNKLVMCHLDLNETNVLLDDQGKVWLIDWGLAGAYPPWFEEAKQGWGAASSWDVGLLDLIKTEAYQKDVARLSSIFFALTTGGYCQPRPRTEKEESRAQEEDLKPPVPVPVSQPSPKRSLKQRVKDLFALSCFT